ncbi:MAG: tRNA preQ1(34) S-adenosylmethionine ribosyltransferase-isomerase QueA [Bacilli bacterium]|jgi:S-adenosylmethionine:tRNA ribosyltransferase-isomerase|nr:tRNA preQ1(34) S-adenosylmethionine ribosyltransferase-isomerase QueA [Acholeplasmataceae bacterium]
MRVDEFDYYLPPHLIAQTPLDKRSDSRLMVVKRRTGEFQHKYFYQIGELLTENDLLVINDTKVYPSRLYGEKTDTKAKVEVLLLKEIKKDTWEALTKPAKRIKKGTVISFGNGLLNATCLEEKEEGIRVFALAYQGILVEILEKIGTMPLPPYIRKTLNDQSRYQTVYAHEYGSAAAPTAGLHFTQEILAGLKAKGVTICYVTLHVGLGTFRPVTSDFVEEHHMHSEYFYMPEETARILNEAKKQGKRIVSVGTTSTRTLETIMQKYGKFVACSGETDIYIYPPYEFKAVDALMTNFHLPKSTLLMLVSAFATKEIMLNAYKNAIANEYRFFSFGDCMLIE